jgi:hypothetical protein
MRPLIEKLKPSRGYGHAVYLAFNALLPILVLLLVKAELANIAAVLIVLSKWRMFAVQPRFWVANIRANAIDIIIGLSILVFMMGTLTDWTRVAYVLAWAFWLIFIKPRTSPVWVSLQAWLGQVAGLMAIFSFSSRSQLIVLVAAVGTVCFFAAHHFFFSFDEPYIRLLAYIWGYFGAALTWVLGHWLVYHSFVSQPTLLLSSLSFGLGTLYYLDHFDKLSSLVRKEVLFVLSAVVIVMSLALLLLETA